MLLHQGDLNYSSKPKLAISLPPELLVVLYAAGADGKEEEEGEELVGDCVVCFGEFEEDKELKVIPGYGFLFHPQCIDTWLVLHGSCLVSRCLQLFGVVIGEEEGERRGEVYVDAMGESGGKEEEEKGGAGRIGKSLGWGEGKGKRWEGEEGKRGRRWKEGGTVTVVATLVGGEMMVVL